MNSEETNTYFDEEEEPDPELNRMTNGIIGCAIHVHRALGPGYLESYYQRAMEIAFERAGIRFERQVPFEVRYCGQIVGTGRLDFLVEGKVIVELKHVEAISGIHIAQVISYLRATGHRLALILNFNVKQLREGIRRIAN